MLSLGPYNQDSNRRKSMERGLKFTSARDVGISNSTGWFGGSNKVCPASQRSKPWKVMSQIRKRTSEKALLTLRDTHFAVNWRDIKVP
jgi:hypothetical protein